MPRSRSAPAAEALSDAAKFTKDLLADTKFSYLKELTFPENPQLDLVAVHGLNVFGKQNAFAVRTWLHVDRKTKKEILWLKDLLPAQLPNARVLLFAYNSNIGFNTSTAGVSGAARDLLARLRVRRQNDPHRPIVFLGHSLGGIVIKHAIALAKNSLEYSVLYPCFRAIAFFATPHRGGLFAKQGQAAASLLQTISGNPRSSNMEALRYDSMIAPEIDALFNYCLRDNNIRICTFYETKPIPLVRYLVVEKNSAILGHIEPLEVSHPVPESNHSNICKFEEGADEYYVIMQPVMDLVNWALTSPISSHDVPGLPASVPDALASPGSSSGAPTITQASDTSFTPLYETSIRLSSLVEEVRNKEDGPQPFHLLPTQEATPNFIGRQSTLDLIQGLLSQEQGGQTRIALYGLGGVGKTQIALKIISWYRASYPRQSIFWLSGRSTEAFRESLVNVAHKCGIIRQDSTEYQLGQVNDYLSQEENGRWLVVIDNADDADTFGIGSSTSEQTKSPTHHRNLPIIDCIPKCSHGKILITTNNRSMGEKLSLYGHVEEVRHMDHFESTELFKRHFAKATFLDSSPPAYQREIPMDQDIKSLCDCLDHLPLAITQAAAFMREQSQSVMGYLELLKKDDFWDDWDSPSTGREDDFSKAVASTWKVAFDKIEVKWPPAADILSLMAFLDAEEIPKFLLKNFEPNDSKLSLHGLGTLQGYALIYPGTARDTFRIHRLVQVAVRRRLDAKSPNKWASITLKLLNNSFLNKENNSQDHCMALLPHAQQIFRHDFSKTPDDTPLLVELASSISKYQLKGGHFGEAEMYGQKAWDYLQSISNPEKSLELDLKATLAQALRKVDQFERAEALTKEALLGQQKLNGKTSSQASQLTTQLAAIYQDQGYYDMATKIARDAIKSREKNLKGKLSKADDDNIGLLDAKSRLGINLERLSEYDEAEKVTREVGQAYKTMKDLSSDDPLILKNEWRLALILHFKEMYKDSTTLAGKTWSAQKQVLGESHVDCVITRLLIANNFEARGNFEPALSIKKDIYRMSVTVLGFEHRYTVIAGENVASGLLASAANMSRKEAAEVYRDAEDLYESAINWSRKNLRPDHPDILASQTGMATVLRLQGRLGEAEDTQRGALKLKTGLSNNHTFILAAEENLARILWEGRSVQGVKGGKSVVKEATKLASRVLKRREKKTGWTQHTVRTAELVAEMLADGKQKVELQRKLSERNATNEENDTLQAVGGEIEWDDAGSSDENKKDG